MINDQGYFKQFPAPIFEASCKDHIDTVLNHSTPYYGPLIYWIARCIEAKAVCEIGVCKAYSAYFLASAVKDNMTRYGGNGFYYGIDTSNTKPYEEQLRAKGLPVTMIQMDSWDINEKTFPTGTKFHLIFQDGYHSEQHFLREIEILYPMLHDQGKGYLVMHDVYAWVMKPFQKIISDPRYKWEYVRFVRNYGLAILRKMDNYTEDADKTWPQGPQPNVK